ncbi:insulinase family protein [Catenovulum maritimum]|uniref:insulinase family protein n=1 Tax=Catenovulum maritimum TaxID=1513271 RepID=UPI00069D6638|nr:insulinase family protein [Catenovulum maritimum]
MKLSFWTIALVASLLTACSATQTSQPKSPAKKVENIVINKSPTDDREYEYLTLANGLRVILISDKNSEESTASLAVGVGSHQNPESQLGLAHFLEHMLFMGTEKYPEPSSFFKFVQARGGFSNAYTSLDHTNYYFSVNQTHFDEALDQFSDYFKAPLFDPKYVDKERTAVDNEWTRGRQNDGRILQRVRGETGNPAHPLKHMSVGNLETLSDKPNSELLAEMKQFYQAYYSANIMNLVLAGKQSLAELKLLAEKHFSTIKNNQINKPKVVEPAFTAQTLNQHIYYKPQKESKQLIIEFPIADNSDNWRQKVNQYVSYLISSEEPGTLGEYLRIQQLANSSTVRISPSYYDNSGLLQVYIELTDKGIVEQDQVIAATLSYINLIKNQGIKSSYFNEIKAMAIESFNNNSKANLTRKATHLAASLFDLPAQHILDSSTIFNEFDPNAISQFMLQLNPNNMRVWHIYPEAKVEKEIPYYFGQYSNKAITQQEINTWTGLAANIQMQLPSANELFNPELDKLVEKSLAQPTQIYNENGIEAWLIHSEKYQAKKGWLEVLINTDLADIDAQYTVTSSVFKEMFSRNLVALMDKAGRAGTSVSISNYWGGSIRVRMQGKSGNQSLLLDKVLDTLANFELSQKQFELSLQKYQEQKRNKAKQTPADQAGSVFNQLMYQTFTDEQLLMASDYVNLTMVKNFRKQLLKRNRVLIFAYGAYEVDTVKNMVSITSAKLPVERDVIERYKRQIMPIHKGEVLNYKQKVEHTDVAVLDAYVSPKKSVRNSLVLELINSQFSSEFFRQLRTEEQLGYQVSSMAFDYDQHPIFMMLVQSNNASYKDLKKRFDKFKLDYKAKLATLTDEEFNQAKQAMLAGLNQPADNLYTEARPYLIDFIDNVLDFSTKQTKIETLKQIEKQELIDLYQSMLLKKNNMELLIQLKGSK